MQAARIQITGVVSDRLRGSLSATDWVDRTLTEAGWSYVGDAPRNAGRSGSPCYVAIESQPAADGALVVVTALGDDREAVRAAVESVLSLPMALRDSACDDGFTGLSWALDPDSGRRIVGRVGASSNVFGRVDVVLEPEQDPAPPPRIVVGAGWPEVQARDLVKRLLAEAMKTRDLDSIAAVTGAPVHLLRLALASVSTEPASLLTLAEVMRLADLAGQTLAAQPGPDYVQRLQEGSLLTVVEVPHTDLLHVAPPSREVGGMDGRRSHHG